MNTISQLRLRPVHYYILVSSSMEQVTGAVMSTLVGVIIPMIQLVMHPELSAVMQGLIGAAGLVGIGIGSLCIGRLADRFGYLLWFRLCPVIIMAGATVVYVWPSPWMLTLGFFICGIGVGGGYSLDSAYISELMPRRWRALMVGIAKASCAIGFIGAAVICWLMLLHSPEPQIWPRMALILAAGGVVTLLLRVYWAESPVWLMKNGREADALKAVRRFFGPGVTVDTEAQEPAASQSLSSLFRGENLKRVIFSGIPWACEGVGVYGIGVFLPVLVMALGIETTATTGIHKIIDSVMITAAVNFFILPGFIAGLWMVAKGLDQARMLVTGFIACVAGLAILLAAYLLHWPVWLSMAGFIIFELFLNGGPHLITFIIPAHIFPIAYRGTG
ncbi:MAG: sugar porter family MFS transporter, partial [Muribaculaceae bacterium]|nr:sugar porter family MFS transporter [Muribaculaceae bacterium]